AVRCLTSLMWLRDTCSLPRRTENKLQQSPVASANASAVCSNSEVHLGDAAATTDARHRRVNCATARLSKDERWRASFPKTRRGRKRLFGLLLTRNPRKKA